MLARSGAAGSAGWGLGPCAGSEGSVDPRGQYETPSFGALNVELGAGPSVEPGGRGRRVHGMCVRTAGGADCRETRVISPCVTATQSKEVRDGADGEPTPQ